MTILSKKIQTINASPLVSLNDKGRKMKAEGIDVLAFAGGEPDFDTPKPIREAGIAAIEAGDTHYVASAGQPVLRKRIAEKLLKDNNMDVNPETQIIVTPGGKVAVYLAMTAVVDAGDDVMLLEPAWVSYREMIRLCGGNTVAVKLSADDNYRITKEALEAGYTDKTKLIIVNSPNNPTGRALTKEEADVIAEFAYEKGIAVLTDEIYEKLLYDGNTHISLGSYEKIKDQVITVNGLSKSHAMTGWRLGYTVASAEVTSYMLKAFQNMATCIPGFVQKGAAAAFDCDEDVEMMRLEYLRRRDYLVEEFNKLPGWKCASPDGAFYLMPQFDYKGMDSWQIAELILDECRVLVAPGDAFGAPGCIRFCYAASMEDIEEAVKRLRQLFH